MGPIGCPETPARNYHYSLSTSPEERSSHSFAATISLRDELIQANSRC